MTTRTRRTPEQLAAYHQRKANQARAKAKKMAKDAKIREQIELGKAAQAAGISSKEDLLALAKLGELVPRSIGPGGKMRCGDKYHWAGFIALFPPKDSERELLEEWRKRQGIPAGPERVEKKP